MTERLRRSSRKRHATSRAASAMAAAAGASAPPPHMPPSMPPPAGKALTRPSKPEQPLKPRPADLEGGDERTNASYEGSTLAPQEITSASSPALHRLAELSYIKVSNAGCNMGFGGQYDPAISGIGIQCPAMNNMGVDAQDVNAQPRPAESGVMLEVGAQHHVVDGGQVGAWHKEPGSASMVEVTCRAHGGGGPAAVVGACSSASQCPIVLTSQDDLQKAIEHLLAVEPRLSPLVEKHGLPLKLLAKNDESAFQSLCRSVVYQQLNVKVASTIYARMMEVCKCSDGKVLTPELVSEAPPAELRLCGLSERKVAYMQGLATAFSTGLLTEASLSVMSEEEMQVTLTQLKGIGPWTVHMYQMFVAGRPDCLPIGDLGIRKGLQTFFNLSSLPTPAQMEALTQNWRPYRSVACFYMWRVVSEGGPPAAPPCLDLPKGRGGVHSCSATEEGSAQRQSRSGGGTRRHQHSNQSERDGGSLEGREEGLATGPPGGGAASDGGGLYRPTSAPDLACSEGCSNVAVERRAGGGHQASATSAMAASYGAQAGIPAGSEIHQHQEQQGQGQEQQQQQQQQQQQWGEHVVHEGRQQQQGQHVVRTSQQQNVHRSSDGDAGEFGTMVAGALEVSATIAAGAFVTETVATETGTIVAPTRVDSSALLSVGNRTEWATGQQAKHNQYDSGQAMKRRRCQGAAGANSADTQGRAMSGGASTRPHRAPC